MNKILFCFPNVNPLFRSLLWPGILFLAVASSGVNAQDLPPAPPGTAYYEVSDGRSAYYQLRPQTSERSSPSGEQLAEEESGPPSPGGGSGGGGGTAMGLTNTPDYGTNLVVMIAPVLGTNSLYTVSLSNAIPGQSYLLLSASDVLGPWQTNAALMATNAARTGADSITVAATERFMAALPGQTYPGLFFIAKEGQVTPGTIRWMTQLDDLTNSLGDVADSTGLFEQDTVFSGLDSSPCLSGDGTTAFITTLAFTNVAVTNFSDGLCAVDFFTGLAEWTNGTFMSNAFAAVPFVAEYTASPTAFGGNVLIGGQDGNIYSFAIDGGTNWVRSTGATNSIWNALTVTTNGGVFAPLDDDKISASFGGVACLNTDGTTNWFFHPQSPFDGQGGSMDAAISVDSAGNSYFLTEGLRFYSVDANANLRWFLPLPGGNEPDAGAALGKDGIYVGSASESGPAFAYGINWDGSLKWVTLLDREPIKSPPIVDANEIVYMATEGGILAALSNGVPVWQFQDSSGEGFYGGMALGQDGTIYIGNAAGRLLAITNNGATAGISWSVQTGGPIFGSPLIAPDGTIVIGSEDGFLYAIWGSPSATLATNAPWPMFNHDPRHSGVQTLPTPAVSQCPAPFLYSGTNDGADFTFQIVGEPTTADTNTWWKVCSSDNLSNWTVVGTVSLDSSGEEFSGTNSFTDSSVSGVAHRYYELSNNGCCSRALGFVSLNLAVGTNLIYDPFCQVDDSLCWDVDPFFYSQIFSCNPMNTLLTLFELGNTWGNGDFDEEILEWTGNSFTNDSIGGDLGGIWANGGLMTLLPGTGALIVNGNSSAVSISLVGFVREEQVFQIRNETNFLSPTAPLAGYITNITGYIPHDGDTIQRFDSTNQMFVSFPYNAGHWTSGTPFLNVGEGFVLITTNQYTWTNNWREMVGEDP